MKARIFFHGVAILVLLATIAAAQTPKKPAKPTSAGQSVDRESSSPSVSEVTYGNAQTTHPKSASSGLATGRRQHEPVLIVAETSLGSAHAPESPAAPTQADKARGGQMQNASTNPMYKDTKSAGNNSLYEAKDKQAASNLSAPHEVVEYKDPEDMTTRYRPGNNKTSKIKTSTSTTLNK